VTYRSISSGSSCGSAVAEAEQVMAEAVTSGAAVRVLQYSTKHISNRCPQLLTLVMSIPVSNLQQASWRWSAYLAYEH
jgi:hypothetical protein